MKIKKNGIKQISILLISIWLFIGFFFIVKVSYGDITELSTVD
ncbi:unnamed protein product, partial [marine sediment metagenome]